MVAKKMGRSVQAPTDPCPPTRERCADMARSGGRRDGRPSRGAPARDLVLNPAGSGVRASSALLATRPEAPMPSPTSSTDDELRDITSPRSLKTVASHRQSLPAT